MVPLKERFTKFISPNLNKETKPCLSKESFLKLMINIKDRLCYAKFFDKRDSFPHSMAHIPKVELILTTLNQY